MALCTIIILSFRFYSSLYYPLLSSDDGVSILMLHNFDIPKDLYYWGQDRYGSLVPLLGQPLLKVFDLPALTAESITHYLLLIVGFLGFATLFKSNLTKIVFAVVWFFPPMHMIDLLRNNLGLQYCLIGVVAFALHYLFAKGDNPSLRRKHLLLLTATGSSILSIWVSDLSIVSVLLLLAIFILLNFKRRLIPTESVFRKMEFYYIILGAILTALFIYYAKSNAEKSIGYSGINNFETTLDSIGIFLKTIWNFFSFQSDELFTSVYAYLILFLLSMFFLKIPSLKLSHYNKNGFSFLSLTACLFLR